MILGSDNTKDLDDHHNSSAQPLAYTGKIRGETYNLYHTVELGEMGVITSHVALQLPDFFITW